ncbi:MAG: hypothetical protein HUU34_14415 [Saprospiraceae bacterium]|nr:hypothetical protein [Saprospiraceae bacterium]
MENQNQQNQEQQPTTIIIQVPSSDSITSKRPLVPTSFAFAIVCFFFTFCDLKCTSTGQQMASVTGIEFVTGTQLKDPGMMMDDVKKGGEKIPSNIWAIFAFISSVIGLTIYLIKEKREALIGTCAGLVGFSSLLILQFAVKNVIDIKSESQIVAEFQFAYWAALAALGFAGIISYLRIEKSHSKVINRQINTDWANASNDSGLFSQQIDSEPTPLPKDEGIDVSKWLKANTKTVIPITVTLLLLLVIYQLFLKHDPVRDGKNIATAFCKCVESSNENNIKIHKIFLSSFSTYNFNKRNEARNKLQELQKSIGKEYIECTEKAQIQYNQLESRYINNEESLNKFTQSYTNQNVICQPSNESELHSIASDVQSKILTIKDPEPDIEKIKSDLIGKKIPGWNFNSLSEFNQAKVSNMVHGSDRIEYTIDLSLINFRSKGQHTAKILVAYKQGNDGWYFDEVKEIFITFLNNAPVNSWNSVAPLSNCSYVIIDNGLRYWVQDGRFGKKYKGGGIDADTFRLTSNQIYIMSREDYPIELLFKYTPKN